MLASELSRVEEDSRYQKALQQIDNVQKPILDELSRKLQETLTPFLTNLKGVKISISKQKRYDALKRCVIEIDDGTPTELQYKGDGIQSLAALGIVRHATEANASGKNLIFAIEEPESHLHPSAIHELRDVLKEMSQQQQVVLSTHNPLFVDRLNISSNIIVKDSKAIAARNVEEIRETLGVRASDNLRHADLVLVVEGADDKIALWAIMAKYNSQLASYLSQGLLAIDTLNGAGNLTYKLSSLQTELCLFHCFMDNDNAGRQSVTKAKSSGFLLDSQVHFASVLGKMESELEDWYEVSVYEQAIKRKYSVDLNTPQFRGKKKWSERMKETFLRQAKSWDDEMEKEVKLVVAQSVAANASNVIRNECKDAFSAFCSRLGERLSEIRVSPNRLNP